MRRCAAHLSRWGKPIQAARHKAAEKRGGINVKSIRSLVRPQMGLLVLLSLLLVVLGLLRSVEVAHASGSGTWMTTGSLSVARDAHTATLLPNGKVLVAGGLGSSVVLASAELYDPSFGTWTTTGSMNMARVEHTATLLPNGKVLVAGGVSSTGGVTGCCLASAELYDPSTSSWTFTGSMTGARELHTATLLPNGKVLVAGGFSSSGAPLASAELYDPSLGTWTTTGSLSVARAGHTATLLPNGQVLVAGGQSSTGISTASAELYKHGHGRGSDSLSP